MCHFNVTQFRDHDKRIDLLAKHLSLPFVISTVIVIHVGDEYQLRS